MRIALVYAGAKPSWVSALTIRENLRKVWLETESLSIIDCPYSRKQNWSEWTRTIRAAKPDMIVFLESMPVPIKAVCALVKIKSLKATPIIFHVYGDFSINTHKWFRLGPKLAGRRVLWLAASAAQHGQLKQFFNSEVDVRCLPFPVDSELYNPFAIDMDAPDKGHRFLYTGRFSKQKNTQLLLEWAAEYLHENSTASFDFAGPFDDIGGSLWGEKEPSGSTRAQWMKYLKSLPDNVRSRIRYHGVLAPDEIKALASKSDCYVSLSTFHDEDFGLAPLESLFCGTRAILTGWGGFSSFAVDPDSVKILPVGIKKNNLTLSKNHFFKALDKIIKRPKVSFEERQLRHLVFSSHFGIGAVSESLKFILQTPVKKFTGCNFFMKVHGILILKYWVSGKPVYKHTGTADPIYERVYRSYRKPDLNVNVL